MQNEEVVAACANFLDTNNPLKLRVTTSQQVANMNDHKNVALVFDMRSSSAFAQCHLEKSINLPFDKFDHDFFINWTKNCKLLEKDTSIITDKYKLNWF